MRDKKIYKTEEIIRRLAAEFVSNNVTEASLLTVTRTEVSPDGKRADVFFTTLPEDKQNTALKFLERKAQKFRGYVKDKSRLGFIPFFTFKIDMGERSRQRLDNLGQDL